MRTILLTIILALLGVQTASADSLTLSVSPTNEYTAQGETVNYNTLTVRLSVSSNPCGPRNGSEYKATSPVSEGPVSGAFHATGSVGRYPAGSYRLCAYLFFTPGSPPSHKEELEGCAVVHWEYCYGSNVAEASFTVSTPSKPTEELRAVSPSALPASPTTSPTVPVVVTTKPIVQPKAKHKPPACRKRKKRLKCAQRHVHKRARKM